MDASKMSFDEWMKAKEEELKRITHGAATVKDTRIYSLESAVLDVCFAGELFFMNLFYIPAGMDTGAAGMYGRQLIMLNKSFFDAHGIDDETIACMFHELCHAYCDIKGIKATENGFHLLAFKEACEAHGGTCAFTGQDTGFNDARPTADTLTRIKGELKRRGIAA